MGALEGGGDLQEEMFIGDGAYELEANWQTGGCETAGNRYCGNPGEIRGAVGAEEKGASGIILVGEADGFLTDKRGGDGRGWNGDGIDACIFQCQVELLDELFAKLES